MSAGRFAVMGLGRAKSEINRIKKCPRAAVTHSPSGAVLLESDELNYLLDQTAGAIYYTAELASEQTTHRMNGAKDPCFTNGHRRNKHCRETR